MDKLHICGFIVYLITPMVNALVIYKGYPTVL